jgi:hypothetical protein
LKNPFSADPTGAAIVPRKRCSPTGRGIRDKNETALQEKEILHQRADQQWATLKQATLKKSPGYFNAHY